MSEGETLHGPAVIAALLRAAYEEGARYGALNHDKLGDNWDTSEAKKAAGQILANAADPTRAERLFGLFRQWASVSPGDFASSYKRACDLMAAMRDLVGAAPFDAETAKPKESAHGENQSHR